MKRIPILFLLMGALACHHAGTRQPETSSKDSALYSDIVRPVTDSIHQFPDNPSLYYRRALLLFNTDPSLALTDFEKAAGIDTANTDYWAGAGEAALVVNDFKKAAQNFQQALQTAPDYTYLQYRLAMAWVENKQYEAADSLANVLAQSADGRDKAFYLKARMAEDKQDTVAAIRHLTSAIQAAGQAPEFEAVMELADLLRTRKAPAALNYYMLAWRLDTTNAHPVFEAGQYQEELNNQAAAMQAYKQCIIADPGFEPAYMAMGKISLRKKDWKEAYNYFNMSAKVAPTDAWAYYYRAMCLEEQGKKQEALADYAKAASFKKDFKEALTAIKRLNP
ncbi:Tetratricopeptide repeat-containing protein [Chitinophaga terrae (ex Kim and Jung 2007)]|uniref:Tetratricopeptide repeat-containing protein n=1 Tax=Chitinophaga terrae (ex Kim and Jung 2007) TaxID=408074 RepID=A0A1H3Z063_9BACT|nr:tetratricopeptide repeat protein [Chitinophaga terrae (ex Kim and Jung 2007)]SEA16714.1 Tetratricopeptide repeat-containing protein [Chitinophaga terrae (ex Kim and Jung 2007)]